MGTSKAGLIKQLIKGATDFLAPMGYRWVPALSEFQSENKNRFDRISCGVWESGFGRWANCSFYRHLPEVENFRQKFAPVISNPEEIRLNPTINTNLNRIKEKRFDLFDYRPYHVIRINLKTTTADELLHLFRETLTDHIFPTADQFSSMEALDQFLHHDVEDLPGLGVIDFYTKKAWLLDYDWLSIKSLYIAKLMHNPQQKLIYEVLHAHMKPYYQQGHAVNDNFFEVLERVNRA